jgi:hypothetical protein
MRKLSITMIVAFAAMAAAACGDDTKPPVKSDAKVDKKIVQFDGTPGAEGLILLDGGTKDGMKPGDGQPGDGQPIACDPAAIGRPCTDKGQECGATATCLLTSATGGFCTCECTVDDPQTPLVNEDNCPNLAKNACAKIELTGGTTKNFCLQTCEPKFGANDCQGKLSCDPRSGASFGFFDKAVCALIGCAKDEDCPVVTATKCDGCGADGKNCDPPKQLNCPTGQLCITFSGGDEGRCIMPGSCDTVSGLCKDHTKGKATAKVGDACKDDTECAGNMKCLSESDMAKDGYKKGGETCTKGDECCSNTCTAGKCTNSPCPVLYRNGYCSITGCQFAKTLTTKACPADAACLALYSGGMCFKTCDMTKAGDCRNNPNDYLGDYECLGWQNLTFGSGIPAVTPAKPVCMTGVGIGCDFFKGSSTLDCGALGADGTGKTNPTNMSCRTLDNKPTTDKYDAMGYCLDDTASGTKIRSPLP